MHKTNQKSFEIDITTNNNGGGALKQNKESSLFLEDA